MNGVLRQFLANRSGALHVTIYADSRHIRLHLVPAKFSLFKDPYEVLIINGSYLIPVSSSRAWLLRTFMEEISRISTPGNNLSEQEVTELEKSVCRRMLRLFRVSESEIKKDLRLMLKDVISASKGETSEPIYLSLWDYAPYMQAPHRMDLIVSPMELENKWHCPLRCQNCYATQPMMSVSLELTTQEWKCIIDRCRQIGIPQLTFTGGEPTVRKDLAELIEYASWFITRLNTSGVTMTPDLAKKLFEAQLDSVQITLYSHDPEVHNALVDRNGAWDKTVQGIKNALEAGLNVSVNTPLVRVNADYVNTLKFLNTLGIRYVSCSGLIPAGSAPNTIDNGGALSNAELYELMREAVEYGKQHGIDIAFTSPGWLTDSQCEALGLPPSMCGACLSNMAISPEGIVIPCQSWLHDKNGLGNFLTQKWSSIWNSRICKSMRRTQNSTCPLSNTQETHK